MFSVNTDDCSRNAVDQGDEAVDELVHLADDEFGGVEGVAGGLVGVEDDDVVLLVQHTRHLPVQHHAAQLLLNLNNSSRKLKQIKYLAWKLTEIKFSFNNIEQRFVFNTQSPKQN